MGGAAAAGMGAKAAAIGDSARNDKRTWAVTRLADWHLFRLGFILKKML